jgi:hypothetical protein
MKNMTRLFMACAAATALVSGCMTTNSTASKEVQPAVMCAKCETTWVRSPQTLGRATVYSRHKKMTCPDCNSAAENFFKTGKFEHTCKTCGDNLSACPACK